MPQAEIPVVPLEARRGIRVGVDHDGLAMDTHRALLRGFLMAGSLAVNCEPAEGEGHEKKEKP